MVPHGVSLPTSVRQAMEPLFGADVSRVRVHADAASAPMVQRTPKHYNTQDDGRWVDDKDCAKYRDLYVKWRTGLVVSGSSQADRNAASLHRTELRRPHNVEVVNGVRKEKPPWFAAYTTENEGQTAFLAPLDHKWPKALAVIASGDSAAACAKGLFLNRSKFPRGNFATTQPVNRPPQQDAAP